MTSPLLLSLRNALCGCSVVLACAIALATAAPAQAGFGDLVKKAKDKATKKEEPKEGEEGPPAIVDDIVFDSVVLELTDQRLGKFFSAYKKAGGASAAREDLVAKVTQVETERNNLLDKHGEKIQDIQRKRDDIEGCRENGYKQAEERRAKEYADKAVTMDPALLQKFARIAQENNAAVARGDTTAANRANAALIAEMLPTREDSLAVQKKCGPFPPPLPAEGTLAKLDKDLASANGNLRAYDDKAAKDQAQESGMNVEQYAIALERIRNYRAWRGNKVQKSMRGYSDEEVAALEKRLAEVNATAQ